MKHSLRIYWLIKGEQNYKIGDKLETENDEVGLDFKYLNTFFDTEKLAKDIIREFETKKRNGVNMCNDNIYITNQTKTILGIMPINKRS